MSKKTVLIDVSGAGASGDMFLSALIDIIGDNDALVPVAASLLIHDPTLRLSVVEKKSGKLKGPALEVTLDQEARLTPQLLDEVLGAVCEEVELSDPAKEFADKVLQQLFKAESRAHDTPPEKLHLHELGTVDTVLDVVGTAYLLEKSGYLENVRFLATPVAIGGGTVKTEHGEIDVPVPAVAEILVEHDVPFEDGPVEKELLTPTGAAILVSLVDEFVEETDGFKIKAQGVGFGTQDLGDVPNLLRILEVESEAPEDVEEKPKAPPKPPKEKKPKKAPKRKEKKPRKKETAELIEGLITDEVTVIETNVDDVDGEIMGLLFDELLAEGLAYDLVMIPAYGKKNRPCYVVKVIAPNEGLAQIAETLIKHLGTLGIRHTTWNRLKAPRETIVTKLEIDDKEFMVRVKVSRSVDGSIVAIKPEADDVLKVAKETGIPIRELKPRIALQAHAVTE
ncbi:MAG: nickel pincer cofactor biosynthesis protein LarC [Candidatus Thorarchaeota archaeon]|nr:MAG: nickel pincer cofactor biosynthesis protein LarC [Candidatus Thorarchaeota archaeon]